ncbi:restriction endonuclease [Microbacteriaceae bacterium K1510]|nr:restriction endonuclease [Microbacteriaceae bacterium K1510]
MRSKLVPGAPDLTYMVDEDYSSALRSFDYCCDYCLSKMTSFDREWRTGDAMSLRNHMTVFVCQNCGWWVAMDASKPAAHEYPIPGEDNSPMGVLGAVDLRLCWSHLKSLDLNDCTVPIEEIKSYLRARYESRFLLHPRKYEELVASVFENLGYWSEVTCYSGDGGIDVILGAPDGGKIGIQVKRYKDSIKVSQIRELLGAMVLNGFVKGVFITTSEFQSGAYRTVEEARKLGLYIDLVDNNSFLQCLNINHRPQYESLEHWESAHGSIPYRSIGQLYSALLGA